MQQRLSVFIQCDKSPINLRSVFILVRYIWRQKRFVVLELLLERPSEPSVQFLFLLCDSTMSWSPPPTHFTTLTIFYISRFVVKKSPLPYRKSDQDPPLDERSHFIWWKKILVEYFNNTRLKYIIRDELVKLWYYVP